MNPNFELSIEVSEQYDFHKDALPVIGTNRWVKNQWPLVYFIQNEHTKTAYVGESTNALTRIKNHLANRERLKLNKISIIGSDKFNKSAALDIEASLIQYISAEGSYQLQNGNYGLVNHNYYQQDLYKNLFLTIWEKLRERKIVSKSLQDIENSELFKYSPYKSLNEDQYRSVIEIMDGLTAKKSNRIFIKGSAGTGKTILATYLIKLLYTDLDLTPTDDLSEEDLREINYIKAFQRNYPDAKIGLVVAMTSLRNSLKQVFKHVPGLKPGMVINPSETFESDTKYDLLIVDEAHRLRQYRNIGWMGAFKKNNQKLGLDDTGTELDWILANSKNQIFFYDGAQSVKPSDIDAARFEALLHDKGTLQLELQSQMRVKGGNNYIQYVDELLHLRRERPQKFQPDKYELVLFDSMADLYNELGKREKLDGLCRLVAGYAWPWQSKNNKNAVDIELDGLQFQWNQTDKDWVNSRTAFQEIGCIHTTQGYDLNYTGVIFGHEIRYNKKTNSIEVDPKAYHDQNGKKGADIADLKNYVINIYKTIMYRGIKGTFVYACDEGLREYFRQHMNSYRTPLPFRILEFNQVKPYVNAVPLVDITAAAGNFSENQVHTDLEWIELPGHIAARPGYFVCQVVGESMNKKIPNGVYCLFKKDEGGSRNGKIVLVESANIQDAEFGAGYTVKEYHSQKIQGENGWEHQAIVLKPLSDRPEYENMELFDDDLTTLRVVGIFERVL